MKVPRAFHLTVGTCDFDVFNSKFAYIRAAHGYTHLVLHGILHVRTIIASCILINIDSTRIVLQDFAKNNVKNMYYHPQIPPSPKSKGLVDILQALFLVHRTENILVTYYIIRLTLCRYCMQIYLTPHMHFVIHMSTSFDIS